MIRRYSLLSFLIVMTLTLVSCWDNNELNEVTFAAGLGLDKVADGILLTVQAVNPAEVTAKSTGGGYSPPVTVFSVSELTTQEALRKLTTTAPRKIVLSHLRILVIGEQLARDGLTELLDGLTRDQEVRSDFYVIVAREARAEDVLGILTPVEKIPANRLYSTLEMSEKLWAPTATIKLDQLISDLSNPIKEAVITGIRIIGDKEEGKTLKNLESSDSNASFQYSGVAIFKDDKLISWLNEEESKGYNYIMNNVSSTVTHLYCPQGGIVGVTIMRAKTKVEGEVKNGKPEILIRLRLEEDLSEVQCKMDITKPESIKKIEKLAEEEVTMLVEKAIHKAQKNKADIFGFGEAIEDVAPKTWTTLKDEWPTHFAELDVDVHTDIKIRRIGTKNNPILNKKE